MSAKAKKAVILVAIICFGFWLAGCASTGITGTYQITSGSGVIAINLGTESSPRITDCNIKTITLFEDRHFSVETNPPISDSYLAGTYRVNGTTLFMTIGDQQLKAHIDNGTITFEAPNDIGAFSKTTFALMSLLSAWPYFLIAIWLILVIIQSFLSYGLAYRAIKKDKDEGDGASLYGYLSYYGFLSLIPGCVIYLWYRGKKNDSKQDIS